MLRVAKCQYSAMSFCCHMDLTKLTEKQCSKGGILVLKLFGEGCCIFGTVNTFCSLHHRTSLMQVSPYQGWFPKRRTAELCVKVWFIVLCKKARNFSVMPQISDSKKIKHFTHIFCVRSFIFLCAVPLFPSIIFMLYPALLSLELKKGSALHVIPTRPLHQAFLDFFPL